MPMQLDDRGLALSTESADAANALSKAAESFIGQKLDTMTHVGAALEADSGCVLAHAIKGLLIVGVRLPSRYSEAQSELDAAKAGGNANEREQGYIAALTALIDGQVLEAVSHYETLLQSYPRDLLAQRLVQLELFWIGESAWMRNIIERAAPEWSGDIPGFTHFQALRAFGNEENGFYEDAERYGRDSIERDPTNGWGAHTVAHVMEMQGRHEDGIAWLDGLKDHWADLNNFVHHLWWHRSLFHLLRGEYDVVVDLYDKRIRNPESPLVKANPGHYGDFQNAVDLLKHLGMHGQDVGDRWEVIADVAEGRIGNHAAPLSSAHVATALAAAGRDAPTEAYLVALREFAATDETNNAARVRTAVLPAAEGAIAHQRGEHQRVLDILIPARRSLWQIGGSHAQRNIFTQMLADSARHLGRQDVVDLLLEEMSERGFEKPAERLGLSNLAVH
jgi:tetratricopeptide (TPR) repeat protein